MSASSISGQICSASATQSRQAGARARGGARDLQVENRIVGSGVHGEPRSGMEQPLEGLHRDDRDAPLLRVIVGVIVRCLWRAPAVARAFTGFLESATASRLGGEHRPSSWAADVATKLSRIIRSCDILYGYGIETMSIQN